MQLETQTQKNTRISASIQDIKLCVCGGGLVLLQEHICAYVCACMCVCVTVGGEGERMREGGRGRE